MVASPLPAYSIYQQQTHMLRGTFTTFPTPGVPTPESLREIFAKVNGAPGETRKLRSLVLCLPNNPTGASLTPDQARELCVTLDSLWEEWYADDAAGFSIILDEVYVGITAAPVASLLHFASERLRRSIFLVSSCSKGLGAMPGARAAWVTAPNAATIPLLTKIQLACTGNACTLSQAGLKGSLDFLRENPEKMDEVWRYYQVCWAGGGSGDGGRGGESAPRGQAPTLTRAVLGLTRPRFWSPQNPPPRPQPSMCPLHPHTHSLRRPGRPWLSIGLRQLLTSTSWALLRLNLTQPSTCGVTSPAYHVWPGYRRLTWSLLSSSDQCTDMRRPGASGIPPLLSSVTHSPPRLSLRPQARRAGGGTWVSIRSALRGHADTVELCQGRHCGAGNGDGRACGGGGACLRRG